ncbi:glycosyltransferase family 9 protein [Spectribacter hydrogenoxidans]|uniref:Glycosyltransferase family 9 protein n=1 Tax=Spectribacter hydrogenoxidans TaxID=3075608 RepID=A0ABU3BWD4_9GAMM|nr:glycosyltransferase family 9 protein [Salinisphaera sp. W335]MDT0633602.1 glycosyltransferase family 9 protein [Salinisphaera sp. W335]
MDHEHGLRRLIRRARRALRDRTSRWLARLAATPTPCHAPLPCPTRILVCRVNKRLGNTVLLTPLLQSLAATFPQARIDVLVQGRYNGVLLENLPGVNRVHEVPTEPWPLLRRLVPLIRHLRRQRYDLAIDPNNHSSSNRLAMAVSGARYRLGFAAADQWLKLTHAAAFPDHEPHTGLQPLYLLAAITGTPVHRIKTTAVGLTDHQRSRAHNRLQASLGAAADGPLIGFFAEATGGKQLPGDWWQAWCTAVQEQAPDATLVQIVRPGGPALAPTATPVGTSDLGELAAIIEQMDGFIAADSGPMHLASATGVPVLGLFQATPPERFAPLGELCCAITTPVEPAAAARMLLALRKQTDELLRRQG